jgi:tagatose 1,6-diphosphate aldolase
MEKALAEQAPRIMDGLNALTDKMATPWRENRNWENNVVAAPAGEDFAPRYADFAKTGRVA